MVFGFDSKCDGKSLEGLSRGVSDGICFTTFKVYSGYCVKAVLAVGWGQRGICQRYVRVGQVSLRHGINGRER